MPNFNDLVFIPNINTGENRNQNYKYSIKSWKNWGDKNGVKVIEWTEPIVDPKYMKITLQRYWVHDILEHNDIEYNQVLIVDADTIIHPDCPNFFKLTNNKFSVVVNNGCYEWVTRSIKLWGDSLFPKDKKISPWNYFNGGFQITNKLHIPFYKKVQNFYTENLDKINILKDKIKAGTDQTIINYLASQEKIDITYLPECFNLQDLFRKNLLHIPGHSWYKDELLFKKAGWVYHFNAIPPNPRDSNYWIERTFSELYSKPSKSFPKFSPISLEYFLNMEVANGGGGKEVLNLNGKLKTVKEIVKYWKNNPIEPNLNPKNWQYYNCMKAGFRKNVADHHDIGWDKMTQEYYESLEKMSDIEIEEYLKTTPSEFDNGFIKHSYHRAYAMIGRLIRGESYIPFYMKTSLIYNTPTKLDNIHRVKPLTDKIKYLKELLALGVDKKDFCLTQSSILTLMGIRDNDDLDIIISSTLRNKNIKYPQEIEVFPPNYDKFKCFGAKSDDDILENFCIEINGIKFLEPRFYFSRKNKTNNSKDKKDWEKINQFFQNKSHLGYPFNFSFYKWGLPYVENIQLKNLLLEDLEIVIDKYDRILEGVNHGRKVYYDKNQKRYIKIFNPEYCRLHNFQDAINSGFLNGLCPSLTHLIYDNNNLIGYISKEGKHPTQIPTSFLITLLKNCKKRNKIYYDLVPQNIIKLPNGQYSLIDLESVYDLDKLHLLPIHKAEIKPSNLVELINQV